MLSGALPPPSVLAALGLALVITTVSRTALCCTMSLTLAHIGLGGAALVAVAATVWLTHRDFLTDFVALYLGRRREAGKET